MRAVSGLVLDGAGFEVLADGVRVGPRRSLSGADADLLRGVAGRYVHAVHVGADDGVFVELGRELFAWVDGDQGQLTRLLAQAKKPLVFDLQAPSPSLPSEAGWAVLRRPGRFSPTRTGSWRPTGCAGSRWSAG